VPDDAQAKATKALSRFAERRLAFYEKVDIYDLLKKPALLYALKGASGVSTFVDEAFAAFESSSEEGALGEALQEVILAVSGGLETGDISIERGGSLWVIELKSQTNTFSGAARLQTLRTLKTRRDAQRRVQRVRPVPVDAAIGILRGRPRDEWLTYSAQQTDATNRDIDGFRYRYLVGEKLWLWLTDKPGISTMLPDFTALALAVLAIKNARASASARLKDELARLVSSRSLPDRIESMLLLADQYQAGRFRKPRRPRST
jgi:hypothetical protein